MLELAVLKGLLDKKTYEQYRPFINKDEIFPAKEHQKILEIIDEEQAKLKSDNDIGVDLSSVTVRCGLLVNGNAILPDLIKDFEKFDASQIIIEEAFETLKKRNIANEVAMKAIQVAEGHETFENLLVYVDNHKETKIASVDDINILSMDISTYAEEKVNEDALYWRMPWLNKSLGPIRKGNLGHLFANPEVGKTAFWVSDIVYKAQSAKRPIVVFFNEEDGKEVVYRMYSSMLGIPYKDIMKNKAEYAKRFMEMGGDKIIFVDEAPLRIARIERIMAKYNPCYCVIDNADKVSVKSMERRDLEIHAIYKWVRELAKEYCPILTVAHADATAYGQKYLEESMMANSKVGKPAEMDFIIGIGMEEGENVARYLSLPKNKLRGDENTVAELRHGRWPVALQADISTFLDTVSEHG